MFFCLFGEKMKGKEKKKKGIQKQKMKLLFLSTFPSIQISNFSLSLFASSAPYQTDHKAQYIPLS